MNRKITLLFIVLLAAYSVYIITQKQKLSSSIENPEYSKYIGEYRSSINSDIENYIKENENLSDVSLDAYSNNSGTSSNFEGPQVHLEAIKFHNEILNTEDERLKKFDAVSAHFDPDHPCYGLPDVKIHIQDVRLYKPNNGAISKYLNIDNNATKPYKIYKKKIVSDSVGIPDKVLQMQLWLTEFKVTIAIKPDAECGTNISAEEKDSITYPGFWYGSSKKQVPLSSLRKEYSNNRYGNLSFILKVIPNNLPVYYKSKDSKTTKADIAIAAIYCDSLKVVNETNRFNISTNIMRGQPLFLNHSTNDNTTSNASNFSDNIESNAQKVLELKSIEDSYIWNKPYYVKLFFNNIGTWRSGLLNQNRYHDQVTCKFIMPIFIVGSWDIIAPQEVLPTWSPPEPYIQEITFSNFIPFSNMGFLGKMFGSIFLILMLVLLVPILLPSIGLIIKGIIKNFTKKK